MRRPRPKWSMRPAYIPGVVLRRGGVADDYPYRHAVLLAAVRIPGEIAAGRGVVGLSRDHRLQRTAYISRSRFEREPPLYSRRSFLFERADSLQRRPERTAGQRWIHPCGQLADRELISGAALGVRGCVPQGLRLHRRRLRAVR